MYCPNCGKQINDGDVFCVYCRHQLGGHTLPPQPEQNPLPPVQNPLPDMRQNQPYYAQPLHRMMQNEPSGQPRSIAAPLAAVFGLGLIVCVVLLFIKPGYVLQDREGSSSETALESRISAESQESSTEPDQSSTAVITEAATTKTETVTAQPPAGSSEIAGSDIPQGIPPQSDIPQGLEPPAQNPFANLSTPTFDDFLWCYGQFGLTEDIPEGSVQITDQAQWAGGWKCFILYTPQTVTDTMIREVDYAELTVNGTRTVFRLKPVQYEIDGEPYDKSNDAEKLFYGKLFEGSFFASGDGDITIYYAWKKGGKEYAVGEYRMDETTAYYVALTR